MTKRKEPKIVKATLSTEPPDKYDLEIEVDADASEDDLYWLEGDRFRHAYAVDLKVMFANQKQAMRKIDTLVGAAMDLWLFCVVHEQRPSGEIEIMRGYARDIHAHVVEYQKLPQRSDVPPEYRKLGSKIDRGMRQASELLLSGLDLYELPEKLQIRREMVRRAERKRLERLNRRRQAKIATPAEMSPPPVPAPKREKLEETPRCDKCGKRPRVTGVLCEPCARWQARS